MTSWRIHRGHVLDVLAELPPASVQCVVTSPPYWGLRDYGLPATRWGGDPSCEHDWQQHQRKRKDAPAAAVSTMNSPAPGQAIAPQTSALCRSCGAWWGQLGLEPTVDLYVAHLVDVFAEVRRVLRPDGTVWLNMGDSYANDAKWGGASGGKNLAGAGGVNRDRRTTGHKPKDLLLMPARIALALQAAGWHVRAEVVWAKPNPMPESVRDRPTRAHEFVYLLTPGRRYFYDREAVREPVAASSVARISQRTFDTQTGGPKDYAGGVNGNRSARQALEHLAARRKPAGWNADHDESNLKGRYSKRRTVRPGIDTNGGGQGTGAVSWPDDGRNLRDVWTIPTEGWAEAHFATFPTALVVPCVKAGTSERGCCPECGATWQREVAVGYANPGNRSTNGPRAEDAREDPLRATVTSRGRRLEREAVTTGWRAGCEHDAEPVPCTVLDPFAGSGTAGVVALGLGRSFVGIELSAEYAEMAERRIHNEAGLFSVQPEADTPAAPPSDSAEPPAEMFGGPA